MEMNMTIITMPSIVYLFGSQNYTRGFATKTTDEMMEIVVEAATELGLTQKGSERLWEIK